MAFRRAAGNGADGARFRRSNCKKWSPGRESPCQRPGYFLYYIRRLSEHGNGNGGRPSGTGHRSAAQPGTDVLLGLTEACKRAGINNGVILSAIGSLDGVSYCNPVELPTKAGYGYGEVLHLTGPIELTSGAGIICHDDEGNTNLHVHMSLSDRYGNAHGGHLVEGTKVLLTVDVMLAEVDGLVMGRKFDNELEVPLFAPRQN